MRSRTIATLTLMALLAGCGESPPATVILPDAAGDTGNDGGPMPDMVAPPPDMVAPPPDMVAPPPDMVAPPPDMVAPDDQMPPPPDQMPPPPDQMPPPDVTEPDAGADATTAMDASTPDVPVTVDVPPPPPDVPMMTGLPGRRGTALVSNGAVMRSPSFRMVSTLGQSSIHQTVMRSLSFRLRGGLVGATGGSR